MKLQFYMPTNIIMGDHCVQENTALFKRLGQKALIVTGRSSAARNGSLDDVIAALTAAGIAYKVFDRVESNPTIDSVYEGAALARSWGAEFVIAIGGGSPMDAGKAISLLAYEDIPRDALFTGPYSGALPKVFIPTTAGTGSEVTQYAILTNDTAKTKTSIAAPCLFPDAALLDPRYMENLSVKTTVNTAIDALTHSIEGYLAGRADPVSRLLALESIRTIAGEFNALKCFALRQQDRAKLLYASLLGGMVIAQTGTTAVHAMGYSLTYFKHIDHGRANGLLIGEFLKLVQTVRPDDVAVLLQTMGMPDLEAFTAAIDGLLLEKEPLTIEEAKAFVALAMQSKNIANCVFVPTEEQLLDIYQKSLGLGEV